MSARPVETYRPTPTVNLRTSDAERYKSRCLGVPGRSEMTDTRTVGRVRYPFQDCPTRPPPLPVDAGTPTPRSSGRRTESRTIQLKVSGSPLSSARRSPFASHSCVRGTESRIERHKIKFYEWVHNMTVPLTIEYYMGTKRKIT